MRVSKSTPINIPTTDRAPIAIAIAIPIAMVTPASASWGNAIAECPETKPYARIDV